MGKDLIIVESPAKVKTIKKFLGNKYDVKASVGHVRDLPSKTLGVDEDNNYAPQYQVIEGKEKVVNDLQAAAAKADIIYLAPDPDREGEAIAWHVAELLKDSTKAEIKRIQFNEITARAVREALEHPRELNHNLFDAQQARRVLDRLVGYKISPLLWNKVKRGISAGRVQSVALRLIVDREKARHAFVPEEYWPFHATLAADAPPAFRTELVKVNGKKAVINSEKKALDLEKNITGQPFTVSSLEVKKREKTPPPPFITSTLQQNANQRLGYTAKRTMNIAQKLYEGLDLGAFGTTALITYMRTDSVRISNDARDAAKEFITEKWGKEYYPAKARVFKTKGSAQDAHEAIRPVDVKITPEAIKGEVTPEQFNLYRLIWNRFVASQMAGAQVEDTIVLAECANSLWRAKGERILFPGFLALSPQKDDDLEDLPALKPGQSLTLKKLEKEQKFTQPPSRYTEAALVKEMEEKGIGRPSTYASTISTLQDRDYVTLAEKKHFVPTDLGTVVSDLLSEHFTSIMDIGFTAQMEDKLDKVADGDEDWVKLLNTFASDFNPALQEAAKSMKTVKGGQPAGVDCPECGKPMLVKFGKTGPFLACSGYPECRSTSNFSRDENGNVKIEERETPEAVVMGKCPECGSDLVLKRARTGSRFIACSGYPKCKHAAPFSTGVVCPKCKEGSIVEKSSKRGKIFYSCGRYPQCDYALWDFPVEETCPDCGSPVLVKKNSRAGAVLACPNKECKFKKSAEE